MAVVVVGVAIVVTGGVILKLNKFLLAVLLACNAVVANRGCLNTCDCVTTVVVDSCGYTLGRPDMTTPPCDMKGLGVVPVCSPSVLDRGLTIKAGGV